MLKKMLVLLVMLESWRPSYVADAVSVDVNVNVNVTGSLLGFCY